MRRIIGAMLAIMLVTGCDLPGREAGVVPAPTMPGFSVFPTPDARTIMDACAFITRADAEAVFDGSAADPQNTPGETVATCTYGTPSGADTVRLLSVLVRRGTSPEENLAIVTSARGMAGQDAQEIAGLGDAAYWDSGLEQLNIQQDSYWIILTGVFPADEDPLAALSALGRTVLERLP